MNPEVHSAHETAAREFSAERSQDDMERVDDTLAELVPRIAQKLEAQGIDTREKVGTFIDGGDGYDDAYDAQEYQLDAIEALPLLERAIAQTFYFLGWLSGSDKKSSTDIVLMRDKVKERIRTDLLDHFAVPQN